MSEKTSDGHEQFELTIQAPGKIILSGEHSVVYGAPALAMAIDRFSNVTVNQSNSDVKEKEIFFDLIDLNYKKTVTFSELEFFKSQVDDRYKNFLRKNVRINQVLQESFALALCTAAYFFARFSSVDVGKNLSLKLKSNIPCSSGMGSSAAVIISILYALVKLVKVEVDNDVFLSLAREIENLQHGHSSGLDLLVTKYGGCVLFADGKIESKKIPQIPMHFIYTGNPETTTGECVEYVAQYFTRGAIDKDFTAVTYALDDALQARDAFEVQRCVKENNKLLQYIGVVPLKVQEFIKKLEKKGLAAKICGAGACRGNSAGVLLVVGEENIDDYIVDYGYNYLLIKGEVGGVKIL